MEGHSEFCNKTCFKETSTLHNISEPFLLNVVWLSWIITTKISPEGHIHVYRQINLKKKKSTKKKHFSSQSPIFTDAEIKI